MRQVFPCSRNAAGSETGNLRCTRRLHRGNSWQPTGAPHSAVRPVVHNVLPCAPRLTGARLSHVGSCLPADTRPGPGAHDWAVRRGRDLPPATAGDVPGGLQGPDRRQPPARSHHRKARRWASVIGGDDGRSPDCVQSGIARHVGWRASCWSCADAGRPPDTDLPPGHEKPAGASETRKAPGDARQTADRSTAHELRREGTSTARRSDYPDGGTILLVLRIIINVRMIDTPKAAPECLEGGLGRMCERLASRLPLIPVKLPLGP